MSFGNYVAQQRIKGEYDFMKSSSFTVNMEDEMKKKLEETSQQTGLGQSEIIRRGILEQLRELEE